MPLLVATFLPIVDHGEGPGQRIPQPVFGDDAPQVVVDHPGLHDGELHGSTRSTCSFIQRDHDASVDRVRTPTARTGAARDHRYSASMHARTTSATSSVDSARMTAIGLPAGAPHPDP
jgi:predicted secreted protein